MHRVGLSDRARRGDGALRRHVDDAAGAGGRAGWIVFVIGDAHDEDEARTLIRRHASSGGAEHARKASDEQWRAMTTRVSVSTPEPALDLLMNGWLLYQTLGCRIWGRSSFYQSSGAFGFRDQLQDVLALIPADPAIARAYILKAASRQYRRGRRAALVARTAPGEGVRTRCSDDRLWLRTPVLEYVRSDG